ncbi:hypothetical protein COLO4_02974 [Corchorus olitorius]|uniref:Uncharacterized protein n=1 Tax=Corchorus olitorius TaxID=93759 RepID=A0A1R3KZY3_9ROSI|nr:hypothetical protein COLO4_02974 [Corchorus olitorius]
MGQFWWSSNKVNDSEVIFCILTCGGVKSL